MKKYIKSMLVMLIGITSYAWADNDVPRFELYNKAPYVFVAIGNKAGKSIDLKDLTIVKRVKRFLAKPVEEPVNVKKRMSVTKVKGRDFKTGKAKEYTYTYVELHQNEKLRTQEPVAYMALGKDDRFIDTVSYFNLSKVPENKTIYLTYNVQGIKSQQGPSGGLTGKSDSGYSLKDNVDLSDGTYFNTAGGVYYVPYGVQMFQPFGVLKYKDELFNFLADGVVPGYRGLVPGTSEWDKASKTEKATDGQRYAKAVDDYIQKIKSDLGAVYKGYVPLQIATWFAHSVALVKRIADAAGETVNAKDPNGMTAKEIAAYQNEYNQIHGVVSVHSENIDKIFNGFRTGNWGKK